jgi:hypothetical protein
VTALLTINLIALAIFAWISLTKIVPAYATSRYRYRLWRIRDDLADDIRHGKFDQRDAPKRVLFFVDLAIDDAEDLSALNMFLFAWTFWGNQEIPDDPLALAAASPRDQNLLGERLASINSALLAKLLFGSVSGWLITIALIPFVAVSAIRNSGRPRVLARASNRIQTDLLRGSTLDNNDHHHGRLYQHVG